MNWDDPIERRKLLEAIGVEQYNARIREHHKASVISTVNGYNIRPVNTRYGKLFAVENTNSAFATLAEAENFARNEKSNGENHDH